MGARHNERDQMKINLSLTIEFDPDEWVLDNRDPREEVRCMVRDLIADNIDNNVAVTLNN